MIALPFTGSADDATEAVVNHTGLTRAVMVDGRWEMGSKN
jgi:hypothetical protein